MTVPLTSPPPSPPPPPPPPPPPSLSPPQPASHPTTLLSKQTSRNTRFSFQHVTDDSPHTNTQGIIRPLSLSLSLSPHKNFYCITFKAPGGFTKHFLSSRKASVIRQCQCALCKLCISRKCYGTHDPDLSVPQVCVNPQTPTGSPGTQQVHDLCTQWICFNVLCFTLQGPLWCPLSRPWDTGEVSTVATLCVLWQFCPLANKQLQTFSVF